MIENKFSIILTGSNGFLGKEVFKFVSQQSNIIVKTCGRNKLCDYIIDFATDEIRLNNHSDLVIHCAGKAHSIPKSAMDVQEFYNVNVQGTINLLQGLSDSSLPKQFVFISSVSVYGLNASTSVNENTPLLAQDPYGKSKIEAEQIVQDWCEKNNVICTILRLPLVVGANPPGNLGAMLKGIKKGYYFNIAGGNAKKSMVLASDVAKFILQAAEVGGTYNLTDGYHPNFAELSNYIAAQLGKSKPLNMPLWAAKSLAKLGDLVGDKFPLNSNKLAKITAPLTFDDSKARASFGWNPTPVLEGFKLSSDAE